MEDSSGGDGQVTSWSQLRRGHPIACAGGGDDADDGWRPVIAASTADAAAGGTVREVIASQIGRLHEWMNGWTERKTTCTSLLYCTAAAAVCVDGDGNDAVDGSLLTMLIVSFPVLLIMVTEAGAEVPTRRMHNSRQQTKWLAYSSDRTPERVCLHPNVERHRCCLPASTTLSTGTVCWRVLLMLLMQSPSANSCRVGSTTRTLGYNLEKQRWC